MTAHQEAEAGRILLAAIPLFGLGELRALAYLLRQGPAGTKLEVPARPMARALGYNPGALRKIIQRLKTTPIPGRDVPFLAVTGNAYGRFVTLATLDRQPETRRPLPGQTSFLEDLAAGHRAGGEP